MKKRTIQHFDKPDTIDADSIKFVIDNKDTKQYCYFCGKETETRDYDCIICKLSKTYPRSEDDL